MRKNLKYIKVVCSIEEPGSQYCPGVGFNNYLGVTLMDDKGENINLRSLLVPKVLLKYMGDGDSLICGEMMTLHMLRYRKKDVYAAAVFAVEIDGEKAYFPAEATKTLVTLPRSASLRWKMLNNPAAASVLGVFGVMAAAAGPMALFQNGFGTVLGLALAARWLYWFGYPMLRGKSFAGIPEMEATAKREGFEPLQALPSDKY